MPWNTTEDKQKHGHKVRPRITRKGGGLAVIFKSNVSVTGIAIPSVKSFEFIAFRVICASPVLILFIYHPPKSNLLFIDELTEPLALVSSVFSAMILIGDINIHVDNLTSSNHEFSDDLFNLIQHVNFPTHNKVHILNLMCSVGVDINQLDISSFYKIIFSEESN